MSECGCFHGLDCTKISVCSHETAIEELEDELVSRIVELEAQLDAGRVLVEELKGRTMYSGWLDSFDDVLAALNGEDDG